MPKCLIVGLFVLVSLSLFPGAAQTVDLNADGLPVEFNLGKLNQPIVNTVTGQEKRLVAYFENYALYTGQDSYSLPHYDRGGRGGCAIGYGIRLSWRTPEQAYTFLRKALSPAKARALSQYAGVSGRAAVHKCGVRYRSPNAPRLTAQEAWNLLSLDLAQRKAYVLARARQFGALDNMNAGMMAVMVALDYQNPSCSRNATTTWQAISNGNYPDIYQHEIFTCRTSADSRRQIESTYFRLSARAMVNSRHNIVAALSF